MILSHHRKQHYQRDPCVSVTRYLHSETGCHKRHTEIGKLACSWKTGREVWSGSLPPSKIFTHVRQEGGQQHFVSYLTGSGMLRWNMFCHSPSSTGGLRLCEPLACAQAGQVVSHQLVPELGRVQATSLCPGWAGCRVSGHPSTSQLFVSPSSSITTILLKKRPFSYFHYRSS